MSIAERSDVHVARFVSFNLFLSSAPYQDARDTRSHLSRSQQRVETTLFPFTGIK